MSKLVALVTGSNRGIGKSTALLFAEAGVNVVINYCHHEEEALELESYIKENYNVEVLVCKCDVSKEDEVESMFNLIVDTFGGLDILEVSRDYPIFTAVSVECHLQGQHCRYLLFFYWEYTEK